MTWWTGSPKIKASVWSSSHANKTPFVNSFRSPATQTLEMNSVELQRLIEDMEDTINDLRGGVVDPILIERQQNILSRMLQAEDALQERDEEEEQGTAAKDPLNRPSPPMSLEELEQRI